MRLAERHGLHLVVRDVDGDDGELVLEVLQLGAHVDAQAGVEVRQRLVHQERLRMANDRSGQGDALALASGELLAAGSRSRWREAEPRGDSFHFGRNFGRRPFAARAAETRYSARRSCADKARSPETPWRHRGGGARGA